MLKQMTIALAAAAMVAVPASAQRAQAQRCVAVSEAGVAAQFDRFNAAWATLDPDRVTALFAPDAVLLATVSNTPRTDAAGIRDYFVTFLKSKPVGTIDSSTIRLGCNIATRVGTWTVRLTNAATGAVSDVKARYSFIYRWDGRAWKIQHLHSSAMPEQFSR